MSVSDSRSYSSSGDGSSKSCIDSGEQLFIISPVTQTVSKVFRPKADSPRCVFSHIDDLDNSKNSNWDNPVAVLVSPRRSQNDRYPRSKPSPSTPHRRTVKLKIVSSTGDSSEAPSSKHIRPPSGRSTGEKRVSRSPKRADRDEDRRSARSPSYRSSSRSRRHDHRSKSQSRRHSREKDDRYERRPSSSNRPRNEHHRYHRSRSHSRERPSDGRSHRDRNGYDEGSRPRNRERNSESRSHGERHRTESNRASSRDRKSESRSYRDYRGHDSGRIRSRDTTSESRSSNSRSRTDPGRERSKSRSRAIRSSDRRRRSRSHSRERDSSSQHRRHYSSSQRSSSRDGRSARRSSRSSTKSGNDSSREMSYDFEKVPVQCTSLSPQVRIVSNSPIKQLSSEVSKPPLELLRCEETCTTNNAQERERASTILQTAWRCYLAEAKYQKTVSERNEKTLEARKLEKRQAQEEELKRVEHELQEIEDKHESDIKMLKEAMRAEKRALKERARRKFEKHVQKLNETIQAEQEALEALNHLEIAELTNESESLKDTLADLEAKIHEIEQENSKLQQANSSISELFDSLNEFARKKSESKKKLAAAAQKLTDVYEPKIKAELKQVAISCKAETKLKELHRGCIYRIIQGVQTSDAYDHELYEEVMQTMKECEGFVGNTVMDFNQSINFLTALDKIAPPVEDNSATLVEVKENDSFGHTNSSTDVNNSFSWGASVALGDSSKLDPGKSCTESQVFGSEAWESKVESDDNWESFGDGWTSGPNLEDFLEKKFKLNDIDCQSHDSWRTKHEDLMSYIK